MGIGAISTYKEGEINKKEDMGRKMAIIRRGGYGREYGLWDQRGTRDVRKRWKREDAVKSRRMHVGEMGYNCDVIGRRGRGDGRIKKKPMSSSVCVTFLGFIIFSCSLIHHLSTRG